MEEPTKRPRKPKVPKATDKEELESLGYEGDGPTADIKSSLSRLRPILMPVVLALAVSYFMISIIAVPKGTYNNAVAGLSSRMTAIETSMEEVVTGQEAMLTSIQSLQAELADYTPSTEQLDSLAVELNNLKAQVAGLNIPSQDNIIAIINSKFAMYEAILDDIEDDIEALQQVKEEEEAFDNEVRWYTQIECTNYGESTIEVALNEVHISPSRIEEADDYSIAIPILNHTLENKDATLSIVFTPKTGSRVAVNEDKIYLDTISSPWTLWATDVVERSDDGSCRRIRFTSEKIRVPAGTGTIGVDFLPGSRDLRLEFTLAYE